MTAPKRVRWDDVDVRSIEAQIAWVQSEIDVGQSYIDAAPRAGLSDSAIKILWKVQNTRMAVLETLQRLQRETSNAR